MFNSLWYQSLIKPPLAPPDWLFAPAWGILYLSIAVSFALYALKRSEDKQSGYIFFAVQLALNVLWPFVFFKIQNIFAALFVIILLDIFVFLTVNKFYSVSKISGIILFPYFIWIMYASYLNLGYLILNF